MNAQAFTSLLSGRGHKVVKTSKGWDACCPGHEDKTPSLSINEGVDGRVLIYCHGGCDISVVLSALNLSKADLAPDSRNGTPSKRIVATYDYTDETGAHLFQVVRYEPKDFRQRRKDASQPDGWTWSTKGVRRVPYRLGIVKAAVKSGTRIILVEGEKDVEALLKVGEAATCNPGGSGKGNFPPEFAVHFAGAETVIVADKDTPGREHAQRVAAILRTVAKSVRIVEVPNPGGVLCKDASDFLRAGGTVEELLKSVTIVPAAPQPTDGDPEPATAPPSDAGDASDIRGALLRILGSKDKDATKCAKVGQAVVEALKKRGRFYFHADLRDFPSSMFFDPVRGRLERVCSDGFAAWLADWTCQNRAGNPFKYIKAAVETEALSGAGTTGIIPESYWANCGGVIYISSGDARVARITSTGVEMVDNGTDGILFSVGRTLAPWELTVPKDPFETCDIFQDLQASADHGTDLLRAWMYSLPTSPKSKPPLCASGEIGSGKTRMLKGVAELFGIPWIANKVEDDAEDDFWPNLHSGGLLVLDNADTRCKWLADCVANAATDGCVRRRRLYTNAETVTLRANAWLAITTANPTFASDAGLADRILIVRMKRREGETSDAVLTEQVLANRNAGLTHIALTLHRALADTLSVPTGLNSRHPDFAAFAVRIGRALGREVQTVAALRAAEEDKAAFCIENDPVGSAFVALVNLNGRVEGTAAEIGALLQEVDPELEHAVKPRRLTRKLTAIWPHLERVLIARKETARGGFIRFTFKSKSPIGDLGDFKQVISINPPVREIHIGTFRE